jgi:hypothetical protein
MHDCRTMQNRLVDLIFDELQADEKLRLLAEVETCAGCLGEYRSMTGTLLVFDQAAEVSLPDESYWPEHRAARRERLEEVLPARAYAPQRDSLWKRIFAARLPVPVPVAAVITLALLASSVLALRSSKAVVAAPTQPQIATNAAPTAPPTVIEVPVVRERVVTRTVYVVKKEREKNEASQAQPSETALTATNAGRESGQGGLFTRANLTDFQPPDELKIRIVKRSNDEN